MLIKTKKLAKKQTGQSLIELLIAMVIFIMVIASITFMTLDAQVADRQGEERTRATQLAYEGLDASKSIKNRGWKYLTIGQHGISDISGFWDFSGLENNIDQFKRQVIIENVNRDANNDIVDTGGTIDFDTKKITSIVNWQFTPERPSDVSFASYLTNWKSKKWRQTTIDDFNQGINNPETENVVIKPIGDGALQLDSTVTAASYTWPFDVPTNYTYDPNKIEIADSKAQLKSTTSDISGTTLNPGFDTGTENWTYADWSQGGSDPNVTGNWQSSGGHPGGWVNINIPISLQNSRVGGFWQQQFNINFDTLSSAIASFDWQVSSFRGNPNALQLYVFLDNNPGQPTIGQEIWTSGPMTGTASWSETVQIDVKDKLLTSGTYYLKLAVWADMRRRDGPFIIGYDNAQVSWQGTSISYPNDKPTIEPSTSFQTNNINSWLGFTEVANKNGGEIYYQLSDDDGITWQYWNGTSWVVATNPTDYNTATDINNHIGSFSSTNQSIKFKAFLESDGTQKVELDEVRINYEITVSNTWPFDEPTNYTYDPNKIEITDSKAQLKYFAGDISGQTLNPGFDTGTESWTYADWDQGPGEVNVTGDWQSSGGNPNGWARIRIPRGSNDRVGGFWQQEFKIGLETITSATASFDWRVAEFQGLPRRFQLYAFLDNYLGEPTIGQEIWTSGPLLGTSNWSGKIEIDVGDKLFAPGNYYFKLAVWVQTINNQAGPFAIGYDNAQVSWQGDLSGYPTDRPTIEPLNSFWADNINSWSGFTEVANKNGGEIYYQLSDDDGVSWKYWDGGNWSVAGANNHNTATEINAHIANFPVTTSGIKFKAFLESDGTQKVELDEVRVSAKATSIIQYFTSGSFQSSLFDSGSNTTNYNYIAWTADVRVGTTLKFQVRFRYRIPGGGWLYTPWYGPSETSNTYFQTPGETMPDFDFIGRQHIQYKAYFTSNGQNTPILKDITIDYEQ